MYGKATFAMLVSSTSMNVASVTVSGLNGYAVAKNEKPDPSTKEVLWRYTAPEAKKGQVADAKILDGMLQLLGTTQEVTRFVDEGPDAKKLEEYGLAPGPRLKIVIGLNPTSPDKERVYEFGKDAAAGDVQREVYTRRCDRQDSSGHFVAVCHRRGTERAEDVVRARAARADDACAALHGELDRRAPDAAGCPVDEHGAARCHAELVQ